VDLCRWNKADRWYLGNQGGGVKEAKWRRLKALYEGQGSE
jgi:hypothetical protein